MNGARYNDMVTKHFASWRKACVGNREVFVAKDYEKFLRSDANIAAELRAEGRVRPDSSLSKVLA